MFKCTKNAVWLRDSYKNCRNSRLVVTCLNKGFFQNINLKKLSNLLLVVFNANNIATELGIDINH